MMDLSAALASSGSPEQLPARSRQPDFRRPGHTTEPAYTRSFIGVAESALPPQLTDDVDVSTDSFRAKNDPFESSPLRGEFAREQGVRSRLSITIAPDTCVPPPSTLNLSRDEKDPNEHIHDHDGLTRYPPASLDTMSTLPTVYAHPSPTAVSSHVTHPAPRSPRRVNAVSNHAHNTDALAPDATLGDRSLTTRQETDRRRREDVRIQQLDELVLML